MALSSLARRAREIIFRSPGGPILPLRRRSSRPTARAEEGEWVWVTKRDRALGRTKASEDSTGTGKSSWLSKFDWRDWLAFVTGAGALSLGFQMLKAYADSSRKVSTKEAIAEIQQRNLDSDQEDGKANDHEDCKAKDPIVILIDKTEDKEKKNVNPVSSLWWESWQ